MSAISDNVFSDLKNLFEDLKKIHHGDEKLQESGDTNQNPEATQNNVDKIIAYIDNVLTKSSKDESKYIKIVAMKSSLLYEKAKLLLSLENIEGCQQNLEQALGIIAETCDDSQIAYLYLRLMNHLAYVISKQGDLPKSKEILDKITQQNIAPDILVYSTEELFSGKEISQTDAAVKIHKLMINNLQMLGWVCCKMGFEEEYALKQHIILQLQLNFGECDPVDWSTRCARIAVLYLSKLKWTAARYHLSAAGSILDQLERDMVPHPELGKAQAELARGWIYYGVRLFEFSKALEAAKRCNLVFDDVASAKVEEDNVPEEEPMDDSLLFTGIDINQVEISASYVDNTEKARDLFYKTNIWLKRARTFYTLRDYPYIYVNCVLDLSELYRYLAYFENDVETQYGIQKRRADALETLSGILKDVRPQCYVAVSVEILKELAEVHLELMSLNFKRIYDIQGIQKAEEISKRIDAVTAIHSKLDKVRNVIDQDTLEDEYAENGSAQNELCNDMDHTTVGIDNSQTESKTSNSSGNDESNS